LATNGKGRRVIREAMWSAREEPGLGHLSLAVRNSGVVADGLVLGVVEGRPFRIAYEVRCDANWRVRAARVSVPGEPPKVELLPDGRGNWTGPDGRTVTYLEDCEYVDISETPLTNTLLPIRRLGLVPGESAEISVAYFDGAELQPWPEPQCYTCLEKDSGGGLYRFLDLDGGWIMLKVPETATTAMLRSAAASLTRSASAGSISSGMGGSPATDMLNCVSRRP
jgi:uncharacterized protein